MSDQDRFLLAGVMGWPVMHSRSPMLHNYWFAQHGLCRQLCAAGHPAGRIAGGLARPTRTVFCRLQSDHPAQASRAWPSSTRSTRSASGSARSAAWWCGRTARSPAATTIATASFTASCSRSRIWRADAGPIAVMGAGGGARAVVYGLADRGAREIRLVNRTHERAKTLAREFGGPITVLPWEERHNAIDGVAMLVNATSQGMVGQAALDLRARQAAEERAGRRHHLHAPGDAAARRRRACAATAPSTGSACCCTRHARPGRPGSASSRRSRPSCSR